MFGTSNPDNCMVILDNPLEYLIKDNILEKPPFELFMFLKIFYINSLNIQMKM